LHWTVSALPLHTWMRRAFKVSLIPHTASVTILGSKKPGDRINIECDMLGKYVEKLMCFRPAGQKGGKKVCDLGFSERTRICINSIHKEDYSGGVFYEF